MDNYFDWIVEIEIGGVLLQIHPSDTLREVKTRIRDQNGIPLNEQFLVIDGVETDENRALASYIKNNSVVHLFRLRDEPIPSPSSHLVSVKSLEYDFLGKSLISIVNQRFRKSIYFASFQ